MIGNNIWNRMKALEKLVELQRSAQLGELVGPPERGAGKAGGGGAGGAAGASLSACSCASTAPASVASSCVHLQHRRGWIHGR